MASNLTKHSIRSCGFAILTLLLITFCSLTGFSQLENNGITVRINHKLLEFSQIDDFELTDGSLSDFLSAEGKEVLNDPKFSTLSTMKFTKVFGNLRTSDSISISRTGDTVYIPPFWATFNVKPNATAGYSKTIDYLKSCYPLVIYAHPNYQGEFLSVPDDTLFSLQQSLYSTTYPDGHINVPGAWDIETGKKFIKVGVFDSGIDTTHIDLKTQVLTGRGYNQDPVSGLSFWGIDSRGLHGHGTPVAGIIGAKRNNTTGVAGIAGGDGSDTSGVSLIDFRLTPVFSGETASRAVVDAARSVGTYYDWSEASPVTNEEYYWSHAAGFGIHIGNHSYHIIVANPDQIDTLGSGKDLSDSTEVTDGPGDPTPEVCHLCREAFLFSLQNGVINVASSGNGNFPTTPQNGIYADDFNFPQNYDDTWIINVGGTGTNGEWFDGDNGLGAESNYFAQASPKMDVAAPWTNAINYTTASVSAYDSIHSYSTFAGTSASAPYVTGIAALLLSKYNQNCYSTSNLDPTDVEYILEHSARDVSATGYDHQTGYGLVNAEAALQMIDFPEYQIVHPELDPISIIETDADTITLFLNEPFYADTKGPLGSSFPLFLETFYDVVRHEFEVTYDFSDYLLPSTQILDYWSRPSSTNSLGFLNDTSYVTDNSSNILFLIDTFKLEPQANIVNFGSGAVTLKGYYYHFIGQHDPSTDPNSAIITIDYWYPLNPNLIDPKMPYSIYLKDSLAPFYYLPCDSLNLPYDSLLIVDETNFFGEITLYPNPGSQLTVSVNNPAHSIIMYSLDGTPVRQGEFEQGKKTFVKTFDCTNLASGIYIVAVTRKDGMIVTKKWIKL
jgi:subtilisin family serine protease